MAKFRRYTEEELLDMNKEQLLKHGRQRNVGAEVRSRMTKDELVDEILARYEELEAEAEAEAPKPAPEPEDDEPDEPEDDEPEELEDDEPEEFDDDEPEGMTDDADDVDDDDAAEAEAAPAPGGVYPLRAREGALAKLRAADERKRRRGPTLISVAARGRESAARRPAALSMGVRSRRR